MLRERLASSLVSLDWTDGQLASQAGTNNGLAPPAQLVPQLLAAYYATCRSNGAVALLEEFSGGHLLT